MTSAITPLLLTVEQAGQLLGGMGVGRVYEELINTGEVPTVKIGRRRRIRYADLEQWVKSLPADTPASPA